MKEKLEALIQTLKERAETLWQESQKTTSDYVYHENLAKTEELDKVIKELKTILN